MPRETSYTKYKAKEKRWLQRETKMVQDVATSRARGSVEQTALQMQLWALADVLLGS